MGHPGIGDVEVYLRSLYGEGVKLLDFSPLLGEGVEGVEELKAFGYGIPYKVVFVVEGEKREAVLSTMRLEGGFGHDFRSDRAQNLILAYDTWNRLPRHAKVYDLGAFTKDGKLISLGDVEEFFLLREMVEGEEYYKDLDRIYETGELTDLDRRRAEALSEYLVEIHRVKVEDRPELYIRKIRDTVGHGECIFGLSDSYPRGVEFLREGELEEIEKKCVEHRWRLRDKTHRLTQVHGDYHPWNVLFRENTDFLLLDRSRGEFGEPADDLAAMAINYIFYSIRKYGRLEGGFQELFHIFMDHYLSGTGDKEILEALPLFFTFRCLVIASPIWYPNLTLETRRKIFNFIHNILDEERFNPDKVNDYLEMKP